MAEAVVSLALETFRDLLVEEGKFLAGVGGEAKALQKQLTEINCLLRDADRKQHKDEIVRNWIAEIRDLAYRAEDAIACYAVRISSDARRKPSLKRFLRRVSTVLSCFSLHQLGREISDIKSELTRVTGSMKEYGIRSILDEAESSAADDNDNWKWKTFPNFEIGDCFVGKEDELRRLCYLVGDDEQHRVISVWGMGGLGKTTIVKKVYNQLIQTEKFDSFAWVCVTQKCRIRNVLEGVFNMLDPGNGEGVSSLSDGQLIEQLCRIQRENRCLVVVDDLWEVSHWDGFKHAFLVEDLKSKILVTTRKQDVAEIGFPVELGLLTKDESWELLKRKSFPHGNYPEFALHELHEIGKEIVRKCGYLPLAISLIGGVLSKKKSKREWELVNADIDSSYRGRHDSKGNQIEQVLHLSYQDLPYFLKPCLLFMARWREDEAIDPDVLYWMWIAQGMISHENIGRKEETLMEIAEHYLSELASRCIVQVDLLVGDGSVPTQKYESCKLHDVVRGLCVSIRTNEKFGVQVLEYEDGNISTLMHQTLSSIRTRHLVMHFNREVQPEPDYLAIVSDEDSKHLRSLEARSHVSNEFPEQSIGDLQKFKMLKSLVVVGFKFAGRKFPRGITSLVHLKHLHLEECEFDELPSSISNLAYLENLCLLRSGNVRVPNVLNKFSRLKYLVLPSYGNQTVGDYQMILDVGHELETLLFFDTSVHELVSTTRMKNLRTFTANIHDNESLSTIINAISTEWTKLQFCGVSIGHRCEFASEQGKTLLKQVFACPNLYNLQILAPLERQLGECGSDIIASRLVQLTLEYNEIEDDPMVILGKLSTLQNLNLTWRAFVGEELTCHQDSFPSLKRLLLSVLPNWREWRVEEGAMPLLFQLTITHCPLFEKLPDGLSSISTLRDLLIAGMPELGRRVSESGEDFHIVSHVSLITIKD